METRVITIKDRATEIPVLVTKISPLDMLENSALRRAGFFGSEPYFIYNPLEGMRINEATYDPYYWNDRTHFNAHRLMSENFDTCGDELNILDFIEE